MYINCILRYRVFIFILRKINHIGYQWFIPGSLHVFIFFQSVNRTKYIYYVFLEKTFSLIPYISTILIFAGFSRFYIVKNTNPNIPIGNAKKPRNPDSQYRYIVTVHFDPIYLSQVTNIASRNKGSYFSTSTKLSPIYKQEKNIKSV